MLADVGTVDTLLTFTNKYTFS